MESAVFELFKSLGVAAPFMAMLFYLLKQATEERKSVTTEFLKTLRETVTANAEATTRLTLSVSELSALSRDRQASATQEHARMVEELKRISFLLENPNGNGKRLLSAAGA